MTYTKPFYVTNWSFKSQYFSSSFFLSEVHSLNIGQSSLIKISFFCCKLMHSLTGKNTQRQKKKQEVMK